MTLITDTATGNLVKQKPEDLVAHAAAVGILQIEAGISACACDRLYEVVAVMMRNIINDPQHMLQNPVIMMLDIMSHDGSGLFEAQVKAPRADRSDRASWIFRKGNKPLQLTIGGMKLYREETPACIIGWWNGYVRESVQAMKADPAYYGDIREQFAFIAHAILRECDAFSKYNGIIALLCYYQLVRLLGIPIEHIWWHENSEEYHARLESVRPFICERIAEWGFDLPHWVKQVHESAQK